MREEGAAEPIIPADNQVDFNEKTKNPLDLEKKRVGDNSDRRRSNSSSSSIKSDESGEYR